MGPVFLVTDPYLVAMPPARSILAGIGILLAVGVSFSFHASVLVISKRARWSRTLVRVMMYSPTCLSPSEHLDVYTRIPPTTAMTEKVIKTMVELLSTIALVTKQTKDRPLSKSILTDRSLSSMQCREIKLIGENEVEAPLQRLERLTRETATQTLEVVYHLVQNMKAIMGGE